MTEGILIRNFNGIRSARIERADCIVLNTRSDLASLTASRLVCLYELAGEAFENAFSDHGAMSTQAALILKLESRIFSLFEDLVDLSEETEVTFYASEGDWFCLQRGEEGELEVSFSTSLEEKFAQNDAGEPGVVPPFTARTFCYVPGTRALIPSLTQNEFDHLSFQFDYLTGAFGEEVTFLRPKMATAPTDPAMQKMADEILQGHYAFEEGRDMLVLSTRRRIPFSRLTMGQRDALWLLNLMLTRTDGELIVREPDAHLSREETILMGKIISMYVKRGGKIFMTTRNEDLIAALPDCKICPDFYCYTV